MLLFYTFLEDGAELSYLVSMDRNIHQPIVLESVG